MCEEEFLLCDYNDFVDGLEDERVLHIEETLEMLMKKCGIIYKGTMKNHYHRLDHSSDFEIYS